MSDIVDPICSWCKLPASTPGLNDRGEPCPCRCHETSVVSGGRTPDTQSAGRVVGGGDAAAHPTNHTEQVEPKEAS